MICEIPLCDFTRAIRVVAMVSTAVLGCDPNQLPSGIFLYDNEDECADLEVDPVAAPREIRIEAGTFEFGHSDDYWVNFVGYSPGEVTDRVEVMLTLTRPFYIDETETTHGYWVEMMGNSSFRGPPDCGECAESTVHFFEALSYANVRSRVAGLTECYDLTTCSVSASTGFIECDFGAISWDRSCTGYRLPTRAEWVYAARAGTTTDFLCDEIVPDDRRACMHEYAQARTYYRSREYLGETEWGWPVGERCPNPFGLHDVYGNVIEYVWEVVLLPEWWPADGAVDPVGPEPIDYPHVEFVGIMGGSKNSHGWLLGSSILDGIEIDRAGSFGYWNQMAGVRLVRTAFD